MEIEEIVKMIIFVIILVVMVWAVGFLLSGKGVELLGSIKDLLRFGR
ncbi:hypothetical protein J4226_04785 [Candidatus Pacearchaeota archaeon]|nr:hypothetical protein [Candidatus Pacearchaeota archaeon]